MESDEETYCLRARKSCAGLANFSLLLARDHRVNIVTLSSQCYLVDVGMNARGPIVPMPMISGTSMFSISPREARLLHSSIPEHTSSNALNMMWRLEVRNNEGSPWTPTYAFSEIEFLHADFEMMCWYTSTSPRSWFTHKILVGQMILDKQRQEIIGDVTLFEAMLRKRIHGETCFEVECKSEKERVSVLQEHFGIKLTDVERNGIVGKEAQIS